MRPAWRLLAAYDKCGKDSLSHGNLARWPGNATPEDAAVRVIELASDRYPDANHTHLFDLPQERE